MALSIFEKERRLYAKQHKIAERQLLPLFRNALKKNMQPVLEWVDKFGPYNVPVDSLINRGVWNEVYPKAFELIGMKFARQEYYYQRSIEPVATKASTIEFLKDVWSGILRTYSFEYANQIASSLNNKTVELIKRALLEGETLGLDKNGFIRWFTKEAGETVNSRGNTFSRTEATRISNLGKDIAARSWIDEQGGGGYKVWLGRIANEREEHILLNDVVIPIDELFNMSGFDCERPADRHLPLNLQINCRCTMSLMSENRYNAYVKRGRIVDGRIVGAS